MTLDPNLPFTRQEAIAAGVTVEQLAGRRFQRLFRGVYASAEVPASTHLRALAALRVAPEGAYVSHHTAGELWGGVMPDTSDTHVTVPPGKPRTERRGILAHRADPAVRPVWRRGLWLSPAAQVFLELAASRADLVDLVVAGDSLVRKERTTPADLVSLADRWTGKGARLARRAARLVRTGVDSAMETRLRLLIVLAGLPEPTVNLILRGEDGEWKRRFDLSYPDLKILVEYDGRQHREDDRQWSSDLLRREELDRSGWRVIVINADAFYRDPAGVLRRVQQALRDRGCTQLPPRLANAWQQHFASRGPTSRAA